MKKKNWLLTFFVVLLGTPCLTIAVFAACAAGKTYIESYRNCFDYNYNDDTFDKIANFTLKTVEGPFLYSTFGKGTGCIGQRDHEYPLCWPQFETEQWYDVNQNLARFTQYTRDAVACENGQPIYATKPRTFEIDIYCGFPTPTPTSTPTPRPTPTPTTGSCTTPQWADGSCPPGTYPNGSGMCCSGACDTYTGSADTASTIINDSSLAPPSDEPCLGNGIYDPDICTCASPVLVHTAGNGFQLSDAAHGVSLVTTLNIVITPNIFAESFLDNPTQ